MSTQAARLSGSTGSQPTTPPSISQVFKSFQSVRSRPLRWVLWVLPWIVIAVGVYIGFPSDPMFLSGTIAAALSLFAFQHLMQLVPETFSTLWSREVVAVKSTEKVATPISAPDRPAKTAAAPAVEEHYRKFIRGLERALNHPWQRAVGLVFAIVEPSWIPIELYIYRGFWLAALRDPLQRASAQAGLLGYGLNYAFEVATDFVIGLMAWRMFAVGLKVRQLEKRFDLVPQLEHPDKCGGLQPLGNLCLWNALIVALPSIYLGGWIIIGPWTRYNPWYYQTFFPILLVIPTIWAIVSFILPLWGVHQTMLASRAALQDQLDQLGQRINELAHEMLDRADELDPEENDKLNKKLEMMQQIYEQNQHYPVWPFDFNIFITFATSQVVPVIGLTGVSQWLPEFIGSKVTPLLERILPHP